MCLYTTPVNGPCNAPQICVVEGKPPVRPRGQDATMGRTNAPTHFPGGCTRFSRSYCFGAHQLGFQEDVAEIT